ncbi:MAG: ubiquinol-cytochrome c reductase iron-sulfur subunit [Candidatus Zixiibacteriota bacterium]
MEREKEKVTRRRFLNYLLGGSVLVSLGSALGVILTFIYPPKREGGAEAADRLEVGPVSDLPEGKAKPMVFQGKNVMVIHVKEGFFAVDMKCTHLGCMVEWKNDQQVLFCPCHAAYFDYKGKVISGPAPLPLPLYKVEISQDNIYVTSGA